MKKIHLTLVLTLIVFALFAITGCSMMKGPEVYYGTEKWSGRVVHSLAFQNDAMRHVLVKAEYLNPLNPRKVLSNKENSFQIIPPGETWKFSDSSDWVVKFTIRYWDPSSRQAIGEEMKEMKYSYNSIVPGQRVVIDEMTLNNESIQLGFVSNPQPYSINVTCQATTITVKPGEIGWMSIVTGGNKPPTFYYQPTNKRKWHIPRHISPPIDHNPRDHTVLVDGKPVQYGWDFPLLRTHHSWRRR